MIAEPSRSRSPYVNMIRTILSAIAGRSAIALVVGGLLVVGCQGPQEEPIPWVPEEEESSKASTQETAESTGGLATQEDPQLPGGRSLREMGQDLQARQGFRPEITGVHLRYLMGEYREVWEVCYEEHGGDERPEVVVHFSVSPNGKPFEIQAAEELAGGELATCLTDALASYTFPPLNRAEPQELRYIFRPEPPQALFSEPRRR